MQRHSGHSPVLHEMKGNGRLHERVFGIGGNGGKYSVFVLGNPAFASFFSVVLYSGIAWFFTRLH